MIDAPDRFRTALTGSHLSTVRLHALRRADDGTRQALGNLSVMSGTFTVDARGPVWRTLNATVSNELVGSTGLTAAEVVNARDTDLVVSFGIQFDWSWDFGGPETEYVQVADLRVRSSTETLLGSQIQVEAADHGDRVTDAQIVAPWPNLTNTFESRLCLDAIVYLITEAYPPDDAPTFVIDPTLDDELTFPEQRTFQGDRWTAINDLAKTLKAWVHNDEQGRYIIEPLPAVGDPVITLDTGDTGTLTAVTVVDDRVDSYSAVMLTCDGPKEGSGYAFVVDSDSGSPTYYYGVFGKKVYSASNDLINTSAEAQEVATAMLQQLRGRGKRIDAGAVYNPLLVPGDTIAVRVPSGGLATHVLDRLDIPIPAGAMTLGTRLLDIEGGSP